MGRLAERTASRNTMVIDGASAESLEALFSSTDSPAGTLPATPTISLLRAACGWTAEQAEQLLTREEALVRKQRLENRQPAAWDRTGFYALVAVAAIVASQLLLGT